MGDGSLRMGLGFISLSFPEMVSSTQLRVVPFSSKNASLEKRNWICICFCLSPDCGYDMTNSFKVLLPQLPCQNGLELHTSRVLSPLITSVREFYHLNRKVTEAGKINFCINFSNVLWDYSLVKIIIFIGLSMS